MRPPCCRRRSALSFRSPRGTRAAGAAALVDAPALPAAGSGGAMLLWTAALVVGEGNV